MDSFFEDLVERARYYEHFEKIKRSWELKCTSIKEVDFRCVSGTI